MNQRCRVFQRGFVIYDDVNLTNKLIALPLGSEVMLGKTIEIDGLKLTEASANGLNGYSIDYLNVLMIIEVTLDQEFVDVREKPLNVSAIKSKIIRDEAFTIDNIISNEGSKWLKIIYDDNETGYIDGNTQVSKILTEAEKKSYFYCAIPNMPISDYDPLNDIIKNDYPFEGIYWQAIVNIVDDDFILNAISESDSGYKGNDVIKLSLRNITEARIRKSSSQNKTLTSTINLKALSFKVNLLVSAGMTLLIFLLFVINPQEGSLKLVDAISISLFLGIGLTMVFNLAIILLKPKESTTIKISLITNDNRAVTMFISASDEEWIKEVLSFNSISVINK